MAEATNVGGELTAVNPTRRLDLRGQTCPTTSDETLRVLELMAEGDVLEVVSDYYPARSTIPYHCDKRGYRYVFSDVDPGSLSPAAPGQTIWAIRIQKR
ncbi:MAG TPA: sulfurtransferase TusA family protein [Chloroflexota bacterium]|nr:sulfurtransferase TusA family protein [Chloroflexota bacterium]